MDEEKKIDEKEVEGENKEELSEEEKQKLL